MLAWVAWWDVFCSCNYWFMSSPFVFRIKPQGNLSMCNRRLVGVYYVKIQSETFRHGQNKHQSMEASMKSAYELAMERLGGGVRHYTAEQKEQLAEIDREIDAKIAQIRLSSGPVGESLEARTARERGVVSEIQSLEEKREIRKERLRKEFSGN